MSQNRWTWQRWLHPHILDILHGGLWVFSQCNLTTTFVTWQGINVMRSWWFPENSLVLCVINASHWPFIANISLGVSTSSHLMSDQTIVWMQIGTLAGDGHGPCRHRTEHNICYFNWSCYIGSSLGTLVANWCTYPYLVGAGMNERTR